MTKEELEKATGQELIDQRDYCGVDGYYGDYLDDVNAEMLKRFNRLADLERKIEALEKANEWHYVKDELPPENVPLNIITLDKDKKRRLWEGEYKGGNGRYWTGYFNHFIDVPYAWKEIVLPELPKESE